QTSGSGNTFLLAVAFFFRQWEVPSDSGNFLTSSGNALCILFSTTEAPILVVPDWNLPFELMCDAIDCAIGAVLGQCKTKHFQPIHYASKTMNEA
nr:reverse transcriptase domain-containing protein [Tanacetum cinerariifolium]